MLDTDAIAALNGGTKWRTGHGEGHSPRPSVRPTNFAPVLVRSDAKGSDGKANASGHSVEVALMKVRLGLL